MKQQFIALVLSLSVMCAPMHAGERAFFGGAALAGGALGSCLLAWASGDGEKGEVIDKTVRQQIAGLNLEVLKFDEGGEEEGEQKVTLGVFLLGIKQAIEDLNLGVLGIDGGKEEVGEGKAKQTLGAFLIGMNRDLELLKPFVVDKEGKSKFGDFNFRLDLTNRNIESVDGRLKGLEKVNLEDLINRFGQLEKGSDEYLTGDKLNSLLADQLMCYVTKEKFEEELAKNVEQVLSEQLKKLGGGEEHEDPFALLRRENGKLKGELEQEKEERVKLNDLFKDQNEKIVNLMAQMLVLSENKKSEDPGVGKQEEN